MKLTVLNIGPKLFCAHPKSFGPDQIVLDSSKSFKPDRKQLFNTEFNLWNSALCKKFWLVQTIILDGFKIVLDL